jgi:excisionase family DNA binding protein
MANLAIQQDRQWLTIKEAAEQLKLHPNSIRNFILRGDLKAERVGRLIRISQANLDALLTPFVGGEKGVWK